MARLLIENGADINAANRNQYTPLILAIMGQGPECKYKESLCESMRIIMVLNTGVFVCNAKFFTQFEIRISKIQTHTKLNYLLYNFIISLFEFFICFASYTMPKLIPVVLHSTVHIKAAK